MVYVINQSSAGLSVIWLGCEIRSRDSLASAIFIEDDRHRVGGSPLASAEKSVCHHTSSKRREKSVR